MGYDLLPPPAWLVGPPTGPQHPAPTDTITERVRTAVNSACELRVPGRYRIGVGVVLIATYRTVVLDALSALGIIGTDLALIHRTIAHAAGVET